MFNTYNVIQIINLFLFLINKFIRMIILVISFNYFSIFFHLLLLHIIYP
nr:MAG TPA: hypothetical protein [Caudoviricetes sp.]